MELALLFVVVFIAFIFRRTFSSLSRTAETKAKELHVVAVKDCAKAGLNLSKEEIEAYNSLMKL